MTKKMIKETLEGDYISDLGGLTVAQAIEWLSKYPAEAVLDENWTGYEDVQGDIEITREETDEEYQQRLTYEKEQQAEADRKREYARKADQKNIDEAIAQLEAKKQQLLKARPK